MRILTYPFYSRSLYLTVPTYLLRDSIKKSDAKLLEGAGIPVERIEEIWEREDVPDIYFVNGATVVDLQFMDHRVLIVSSKEVVYVLYRGEPRLVRWLRNVLRKKRKFLEDHREFLYHAIDMELEILNEAVLDLHKEMSRYERRILENIKTEEEKVIFSIYEAITKLLDIRRELTYFYRMLVKLRKVLRPEALEELRSSIQETVSLINLSLSTARSLLDVHDKVLSMELNLLIKRLTAISIILAVITIITGIYGMNFRFLPLADHPHGFWLINGLMVALFVLMWWWFKKIGWM